MSDLAIRFLRWARTAPDELRAEGAGALAASLAVMPRSGRERSDAVAVLSHLLDDPSAVVRRAMADELAEQADAPAHLVSALAADVSDVAVSVLSRSAALGDAELLDISAHGDDLARLAIALRDRLSPALVGTLCEKGTAAAVVAMCRNPGASWRTDSLDAAAARHGSDPEARAALLERGDLPVAARHALLVAEEAAARPGHAGGTAAAEAPLRAAIALSPQLSDADRTQLVRHLRGTGQLTAGLLLAAMAVGDEPLLTLAMADLAGLEPADAAAVLAGRAEAPRRALYARAKLPSSLREILLSAHAALREARWNNVPRSTSTLARRVLDAVLAESEARPQPETLRAVALVRRVLDDLVRDEARVIVAQLERAADELPAPAPLLLEHVPAEALEPAAALAAAQADEPAPDEVAPRSGEDADAAWDEDGEWLVAGPIAIGAMPPTVLRAPAPHNDEVDETLLGPAPRRAFGRRAEFAATPRPPLDDADVAAPPDLPPKPEPSVADRIRTRVLARLQARRAA